jgi:hypothetical protein
MVAWISITIVCIRAFPSLGHVMINANSTISAYWLNSEPSNQKTALATPFKIPLILQRREQLASPMRMSLSFTSLPVRKV